MKILEIIPSLSPGGAERLVVDLCNEMSKTEDVTLLLLKDLSCGNNNFYLSEVSSRVKIEEMKLKDGFHFCYLFKVWKKIRALDPDIVHMHLGTNKYCIFPIIFSPVKMKVFQTIHNDVNRGYSSGFHKFQILGIGKIKLINYITISQTNYEDFSKLYPTVSNTLIYNGRTTLGRTEQFLSIRTQVENLKTDKDSLVLLHIARCAEQKNQRLLIRAFNQWIDSGANAILLVIGAGFDSEYGMSLREESYRQIKYLGTTPYVADYMYCSDAFILSSNYEGMPITAIEALITGLPILSTPVCGIVDVVRSGENGLLTKDWTEEQFLKMLNDFERNHMKLKEIAERESADSPYRIEKCSAEYLRLFSM